MLMIAFRKKSALHLNDFKIHVPTTKQKSEKYTGIARNLVSLSMETKPLNRDPFDKPGMK